MGRLPALSTLLAVLATLALPACGSADDSREASRSASRRGVALKRIGSFDDPVYVTGAPGFPKLLFVVSGGR